MNVDSQCVHIISLLPPAMDTQIMLVHNTLWSRRFFRRAAQLFDSPAELSQVQQTLFIVASTAPLSTDASTSCSIQRFSMLCMQSIDILAQLKPKYNVSAPTDRLVIGHILRHR
jgi:hypothetical protein